MDVEIQINAASAAGELGSKVQKFIYVLLSNRIVDYVGTDAHNDKNRAPEFQECYRMLQRKFDSSYIDEIFYKNAMAIINAE